VRFLGIRLPSWRLRAKFGNRLSFQDSYQRRKKYPKAQKLCLCGIYFN